MFSTRLFAAAALAVGLVAPVAAFAQTPAAPVPPPAGAAAHPHHHHHHRGALRAALGKLNLSGAQKSQLAAVFANARQHRQATRSADPATRKANMQRFRAQIDNILTPAQRSQFRVALQQERAQRRHWRATHPGTTPS